MVLKALEMAGIPHRNCFQAAYNNMIPQFDANGLQRMEYFFRGIYIFRRRKGQGIGMVMGQDNAVSIVVQAN